jgi:hypothetical protein
MWIRNAGSFGRDDQPKLPSLSLLMVLLTVIESVAFTALVLLASALLLAIWG